jgi:predicted signal transduction protein with EAL and GGDEF domain
VLQEVARRLRIAVRPTDTVARFGGDEFAVLLESVNDSAQAADAAARILHALELAYEIDGKQVFPRASIGICLVDRESDVPEAAELLRNADVAMYMAKRDSKGSYRVFEPAMHERVVERLELRAELQHAIEGDELELYYQPVVRLAGHEILGVEALLRWQHPTRGLLSPFDFLIVAEELDIIIDVGRWVIREACRQLAAWNALIPEGERLTVAVNLSARQFVSTDFLDDVGRAVSDFGLAPASLALEVNERVVARDMSRAVGVLTGLRSLGTRIHLDDFGSGNSPIGYLQRLPLDGVKIDHTLVNRMDRDEKALRLVRSVVGLAREFGLDVVAEGITSAGHLKVLQEIGCTHGQGPLFSPAVDAAGITAMLAQRPW